MTKLNDILQVILDIQKLQGTKNKTKQLQLSSCRDAGFKKDLKHILCIAFDPFTILHISKIENKYISDPIHSLESKEVDFDEFVELCQELRDVKAINNQLRTRVENLCSRVKDADLRELLIKIITKKINIGIGAKAVNQVFPELIFDKEVMLAEKDPELIQEWKVEDIVVNTKYDGIRLVSQWDVKTQKFIFLTRNFNIVPNEYLKNIDAQLQTLLSIKSNAVFFDGELIAKSRTTISGELNKMLKGTFNGTDIGFEYHVFDYVQTNILIDNDECSDKRFLKDRIKILSDIMTSKSTRNVILVENHKIKLFDEIRNLYDSHIADGQEGVLVKNLNSFYEYKRSNNWVKFKEINTADLEIIELIPGEVGSKYAKTIGAIVCKTSDGKLQTNVGSGFSDEDRDYFWKNKSNFIGKIVEVEYNMIIENKKNSRKSLFLPRFKVLRADKNEANKLKDLK